jgi:protein-tyrosine-phosphatase
MSAPWHVLFLCTGNSARSILAECLLNRFGEGRFVASSAGSFPKGSVHPQALALLEQLNYPIAGLRSKSWDEFAGAGAPPIDFVITVCDNAAGEVCPIWPGHPVRAHWGIADPAAVESADQAFAFADAYDQLSRRIRMVVALPVAELDAQAIERAINEIGTTADIAARA